MVSRAVSPGDRHTLTENNVALIPMAQTRIKLRRPCWKNEMFKYPSNNLSERGHYRDVYNGCVVTVSHKQNCEFSLEIKGRTRFRAPIAEETFLQITSRCLSQES